MSIIAYQGELEFDGAFWDDQGGWRVRWRLVGSPEQVSRANPMKKFTKRRGERVGTIFLAALVPVAYGKPYNGEVMLGAWADSTSGWSVTFEHPSEPEFVAGCLRRTKDRPGTRYMGALSETDEDGHAVQQEQRERVEQAQLAGKGAMLLSNRAAILMKNHMFHEWLRENVQSVDWGETSANGWLKNRLGIASKADLDDARNTRARSDYIALVRQFEDWRDDGRIR